MPEADLDFRLLAALSRDPLLSHAGLARAAGTSASTARRRLHTLEQGGVLRGIVAIPAAEAFGREAWVSDMAPDAARHIALDDLLAIDDVVWADRNHDGTLGVMSFVRPGASLPPRALLDALGTSPAACYRYAPPAARGPIVLSPLDWRIVAAILTDPRAGIVEIAARAGLSPKTVRKRRAELVNAGILDVFPLFGPSRAPGPLFHHLAVYADDPSRFPAIAAAASPAIVGNTLQEPCAIYLFCRAESALTQQETQRRVASLPGVSRVRFVLNVELAVARARLAGWVDGERRRWDAARRSVSSPPLPPPA